MQSKRWVGKRVWINLASIGFSSLFHVSKGEALDGGEHGNLHQEQVETKNKWLEHMALKSDMCSERDGIKVRPIPGLPGVDYLTGEGGLGHLVSYVFGPVIEVLREAGLDDQSLQAAPYDWRLPPHQLEARDLYFKRTMEQIRTMAVYNQSPVVLLCHSLGVR